MTMPSLFIPHGGGPAFFMTGPMHDLFQPMQDFLAKVLHALPRLPRAIIVMSAASTRRVVMGCFPPPVIPI